MFFSRFKTTLRITCRILRVRLTSVPTNAGLTYRSDTLESGTQSCSTSTSRRMHSSNSHSSKALEGGREAQRWSWSNSFKVKKCLLFSLLSCFLLFPVSPSYRKTGSLGRLWHALHVEHRPEEAESSVIPAGHLQAFKQLVGKITKFTQARCWEKSS